MNEFILLDVDKDEQNWQSAKKLALQRANFIEFNILYISSELDLFIEEHQSSFVEKGTKQKLYKSGEYIRFRFSKKLKNFISSSTFNFFSNRFIEDPSFYLDDLEIIATVTHEYQICYNKAFLTNWK